MIFVTVGTQLPFDRLIRSVAVWAGKQGLTDIVFQSGPEGLLPEGFTASEFLSPDQFEGYINQADIIVGHAGMGTILKGLELAKPVVILPRLKKYGEHRNDHQVHTAEKFGKYAGVYVASDEHQLPELLDAAMDADNGKGISRFASDSLTGHLRDFISGSIKSSR